MLDHEAESGLLDFVTGVEFSEVVKGGVNLFSSFG
jgi:hypothetical protein